MPAILVMHTVVMLTRLFSIPLLCLALVRLSCQRDPGGQDSTCPDIGCLCASSATCGVGLGCDLQFNVCVEYDPSNGDTDGGCDLGHIGCACAAGLCFPDPNVGPLECVYDSCIPDDCPEGDLGCECYTECNGYLSCLDGVCVDISSPACLVPYDTCFDNGGGQLGDCCEGTICLGYEESNIWHCSPACSAHSDCVTDCCVLVPDPEGLFCAPTSVNCLKCIDTCYWAKDGACDDGGPGSDYSLCELGSDCADCGAR